MIRAWLVDARGARESDPAEAASAAVEGRAMTWIDFTDDDEEQALAAIRPFDIHPLAIEDMFAQVNRPKVDNFGRYLYLVLHSARWNEDRPTLREIDFVLGERFLVTCHAGEPRSISAAHEIMPRRPELLAQGPSRLLHFVLDVLVDHYMPIMDRISEMIDSYEEQLFDRRGMLANQRILHLKRGMAALRRILGPQRDTLLALTRDEFHAIPADMRPYLRDVYDRLARVHDFMDSFRDEVATLLELQVSTASNRLNEVIKRLTVVATVGLPLTVVTSYYGMNFQFAEYGWRYGWAYVLGLLALTAGVTWWFLKKKRWM